MSTRKRDVESIRQKNVEDNQLFLKQLLLTNIRDDFINSARSIVPKRDYKKIQYEKVEHSTRYSLKVKSGEILERIPQWQLEREQKLTEREQKKKEKEMRRQMLQERKKRLSHSSKWTLYYKSDPNPYRRLFKPRHTKTDERIQQGTISLLDSHITKEDHMTKKNLSSERNVENIRQKNVQDNQIFLENLLMTNIRNDFLSSARSILRKHDNDPFKKKSKSESNKKEYTTRYSEKIKSGEIGPFVPEWQRQLEEKKKQIEKKLLEKERKKIEAEQRLLEKEEKRLLKNEEKRFKIELRKVEREILKEEKFKLERKKHYLIKRLSWIAYYKDCPNGNPYQRIFKPRLTKIGQQAE